MSISIVVTSLSVFLAFVFAEPQMVSAQQCERMELSGCKLRVKYRRRPDGFDKVRVKCMATLGAASDGIDPVNEGIALTFTDTDTLWPGCFEETVTPIRVRKCWQYKAATKDCGQLRMLKLCEKKAGSGNYKLVAKVKCADLQCLNTPILILGVIIGNDCGTWPCPVDPNTGTCGGRRCGDGTVTPPEECDDGEATCVGGVNDSRACCVAADCPGGSCGPGNRQDLPDACRCSCVQAFCGDAVQDAGEECDNGVNNSDTMPDACRTDCTLPRCLDGVADTGEECDGSDLRGETCQSRGYAGGTLSCSGSCTFDESGCTPAPTPTPTPTPGRGAGLPDSGQTICYDGSGNPAACTGTSQDGEYLTGCQPSYTDNGNGTVRDDCTGLVWQQGTAGPMNWAAALDYCNTLSLGGAVDWRLANVKELMSIANYGVHTPASSAVFSSVSGPYWSSTTRIFPLFSTWAWWVDFTEGDAQYDPKSTAHSVRCVRGGPLTLGLPDTGQTTCYAATGGVVPCAGTGQDGEYPSGCGPSFYAPGDGTVLDTCTKLVWQKCAADQGGTACASGTLNDYNWSQALAYCENLNLGGKTDWRLPNVRELMSIANYQSYDPGLFPEFSDGLTGGGFWTSTSRAASAVDGWAVTSVAGEVNHWPKAPGKVRCVRGGLTGNNYSIDLWWGGFLSIQDWDQTGLDLVGSDLTFEMWVKLKSAISGTQYLIQKGNCDGGQENYRFVYLSRPGSEALGFAVADGGGESTAGAPVVLPIGIWQHLAVVYDRLFSEVRFYVNGSQVPPTGSISRSIADSQEPFKVGSADSSCGVVNFYGKIDEVRVWNVARTPAQINQDVFSVLSGGESNLVGYWRLENDPLSHAVDSTPNDNNLAITDPAPFSADVPF